MILFYINFLITRYRDYNFFTIKNLLFEYIFRFYSTLICIKMFFKDFRALYSLYLHIYNFSHYIQHFIIRFLFFYLFLFLLSMFDKHHRYTPTAENKTFFSFMIEKSII